MEHEEARHSQKERHAGISSLRFQVIAIMLLCYLIPTALLGFFTRALLSGMRQRTEAALAAGVEHAWTQTMQHLDHAVALGREAIYDGELASAYDRWKTGEVIESEYLRVSRAYMERKYSRDSLCTFAAFFPVSRPELFISTRTGYEEAMRFLNGMQRDTLLLGETLDTANRFLQEDGRIYLVRNMVDLQMQRYGMLVIGISRNAFFEPLISLAKRWNGTLRLRLDGAGDEDGWEKWAPYLSAEGDEVRCGMRADTDDDTLEMLLTMDGRELYREDYEFRMLSLAVYLLLIPILGLLGFYVSRRIIRPVSLLSSASRRIENGELGVTVPMRGNDELGELGRAFSRMSQRIEELIDKTYKEELALKDAQIGALQSRINPHFINNALEAINWEARIEKSEVIPAMVGKLSVLLDASMARQDRRMVPLSEEIEVAGAYIYFVQQRFGDSLTVRMEAEEEARDCPVPLLTLQPVLENAVEHGIAPAGGGEIDLVCRNMGSCVRIDVRNSGRGIDPRDREKIDAALRGETGAGSHLGLANIAGRLRLIYSGLARIEVSSGADGRTLVRMDIPRQVS